MGQLQQHADAADRARRAWSARIAGGTWREAAEVAGFTDGNNCQRAVRNFFGSVPQVDTSMERELWRQRMEKLWTLALRDAQESKPGALRAGVAVAQRSSLLLGLDAPTQSVHHVEMRGDLAILDVVAAGGLPTVEERAKCGLGLDDVSAIRAEHGQLDSI